MINEMLYKSDSQHAVEMMRDDPNMFQEVNRSVHVPSNADRSLVSHGVPTSSEFMALKPSFILRLAVGVLSSKNGDS